ncbi:MAG: TetR/AcrR family transcriptional regulator, partial [Muribaculaceae bacterium]
MVLKTRERLIEVARQLFAHKGVANTTMNDIASASDKGRRTIYTYFRNKAEIYNAVLESESDRLVNSLRQIAESNLDVEAKLRKFLRFRLENNTLQASSSIKSWFKLDGRRLERINRLVQQKENRMLRNILEQGCLEGIFDQERCTILSAFVNQCISSLVIPPLRTEYNVIVR